MLELKDVMSYRSFFFAYLLLGITFLFPALVLAQTRAEGTASQLTQLDKIDSLRSQARSSEFDIQMDAVMQLAQNYTSINADSALHYYDQLSALMREATNSHWDEAFYNVTFNLATIKPLRTELRFSLLNQVASYAENTKNYYFLMHVYRQLSQLFFHASELDKSLDYQLKAMEVTRMPGMPAYTKAFPYISLAHIYGSREQGRLYADTASAMIEAGHSFPPRALHWLHTHMGTYYQKVGMEEIALANYQKAHAFVKNGDVNEPDPYLLVALGKIFLDKNDFEKAESYYQQAEKLGRKNPRLYPDPEMEIAHAMVQLALKTNRNDLAEANAMIIVDSSPSVGYLKYIAQAHRTLYKLKMANAEYAKANKHLSSYFIYSDSLDAIDKRTDAYFHTKALELATKRHQIEVVEANLKAQKSRSLVVTVILLFTFTLLIFLLLSWIKYKNLNTALSVKNEEVRKSNEALLDTNEQLTEAKIRAEESDRLKSSILQNMSHEIRTPLTSILGYAEMIEDANENKLEIADQIQRGGRRLMDTLNSVMDLAQLEGGAKLNARVFRVNEVIQKNLSALSPVAEEKGLVINVDYLDGDKLEVEADKVAFERVLNNLMHNAIHFTESGSVCLQVQRIGQNAVLKIEDTGIGMTPKFLLHAFEPFRQESTGHGRTHEGMGLGLTIVKRLVELMEGRINVVSRKGQGSTFTLTLPIAV